MKKQFVLKTLSIVTLALCVSTPALANTNCNVRRDDSMWRIAKRYHLSFKKMLELNDHFKNVNVIHPEDLVTLPHQESEGHSTNQNSNQDKIQEGNERTSETQIKTEMKQVLELVNQERAKNGIAALTLNNDLTHIANMKATDMKDKNYFSHNSPTYGTPFEMLQQFGVKYSYAGENIAAGQKTPEQVMNDWMNSSGHRANILNKNYTQLGVGYVQGGEYGTYWVQLFTRPQ